MDLRRALLITLATAPLTSCYLHCRTIPSEDFAITSSVTFVELEALLARHGLNAYEQLSCESVCTYAYERERGWKAADVYTSTCVLELPRLGEDGAPPTLGTVKCEGLGVQGFCKGRRPLGHVEAHARADGDALGETLAAMAHLEAASVVAFEQLAAQLAELDAPTDLIERCWAAADDERKHARWLTRLAARRGARTPAPILETHAADPLAIALHNAVEGCVHEAFAALVAAVVSRVGSSVVLRRIYARIADDETRHGQLAWDLHAYFMARLPSHERELVDAAQREALTRLPERVGWLTELPREFGSIPSSVARALAVRFTTELAAAA